jgi:SAM-dependent methyltransferase
VAPHWTDAYYGALYLDSVEDLLTPSLSALEVEAIATLLELGRADRVLDLACGHGRHAFPLAARVGRMFGIDRSGVYLRRATPTPTGDSAVHPERSADAETPPEDSAVHPERSADAEASARSRRANAPRYVQGDVRALPFGTGSFDALYSWYASLFMFDDATNEACLAEAARVVRPGGRILVHHANPASLAADPIATACRTLRDGSVVEERSTYDATRGVDVAARRIVRPGGAVLAGRAELRYYMPSEWRQLAARARLRLVEVTSTPDAGRMPRRAPGPEAPDLIAVLEKPT